MSSTGPRSPFHCGGVFAKAWNDEVTKLLKEKPWPFEAPAKNGKGTKAKASPTNAHRRILRVDTGYAFCVLAKAAREHHGQTMVADHWESWVEETLKTLGITREKAIKDDLYGNFRDAAKQELTRILGDFVYFELFKKATGGVYVITARGNQIIRNLETENSHVEVSNSAPKRLVARNFASYAGLLARFIRDRKSARRLGQ